MKKTNLSPNAMLIIFFFLSLSISYAQDELNNYKTPPKNPITVINQDSRIKKALAIKSKMDFNERYKIQLYYGNLSGANDILGRYRKDFAKWPSSIEYETPNHKVWIGNFRNRLEADRALVDVQRKFPNAFVFTPDRN